MQTTRIRSLPLLAAFALRLLTPAGAYAAWPHDPNNGNVALCTAANDQNFPAMVQDGAGGAIATWEDARGSTTDIYTQRVSAVGVPQWAANGVPLCTAANSQSSPKLVLDGSGGAIVAWVDYRNPGFFSDIYAQRVTAGTPQWTTDGVALCTFGGDQLSPTITSDGAGGAIIAWLDSRSSPGFANYDVYALRVNAAGVPQWTPGGVALCTSGQSNSPSIVPDGVGGVFVIWADYRGANYDIYAIRVNSAGTPMWPLNGVALCTASGDQVNPTVVSDGAGGLIVAWDDRRSGNFDVYAQRVSAAGTPQWAANGVALCSAANDQSGSMIVSDGAGGAIVTWGDRRSGTNYDIYAQRVYAGGTVQWAANGVALCTVASDQFSQTISPDGAGGAIVTWRDTRNGNSDIYAQRASAAGVPQWTADGMALCTAVNNQLGPTIASDGVGGAIVAWYDLRGGNYDIYAQRIERFGYLGSPEPVSAGIHDVPNDQGGQVKFSWYPSYPDRDADPNLTSYDVYRSAPGSVAAAAVRAGARQLSSFAEVPVPGESAFVVEPAAAQLYAWEYLTTFNAVHFLDVYGYVAPTTGDSIAGSNPLTIFMVVGRNASGSLYWLSAPDSGYSVDNIGPAAPTAFVAQYINPAPQPAMDTMTGPGFTWLHWGPSREPDFLEYRLHRGTSAGFTPGPANLLSAQPDTGYQDVGPAGGYYKLLAVDRHGNGSTASALTPADIVGVVNHGAARLWLGPAQPNPVVSTAEFRFGLTRAGRVRLTLFDPEGRRVRELVSGYLPAGEHSARWDGRDGAGRRVPSGLYVCRLEAGGRTLSQRLAAVR